MLFHNKRAVFGDFGFDEKDFLTNIDVIRDSLIPCVFADHVFLEEGKCALIRRRCQANQESVEVFQHLAPHVIDGAVAFVNNDTVEEFRRIGRVIDHFTLFLRICGGVLKHGFFFRRLVQFLPGENRVHPLNCADANVDILWNGRFPQSLDDILIREQPGVIVGLVGTKLLLRLDSQTFRVHKEQDALHMSVFEQTIGGSDSGECFARAGCHLNECAGPVIRKGLIQILNG